MKLSQHCLPHLGEATSSERGHKSQRLSCTGFLWASRRWASAKVMHLRLQYSDTSREDWISSITHAAASLSRLEELVLDCSHEISGDWARILSAPLLNNVLRTTQRLRLLELCCHTFKFETPLQSLQHLLLSLGGGKADVDLSTLALAPNLVTMRLSNLRLARDVRVVPEHLDLRPLSKLTAVSLERIVPTQLSLPQQCHLAVLVDQLAMARAGVWDSVHSHIHSFAIHSGSERLTAMSDLPAVLLREPPVRRVALVLHSFGTAMSPLQLSKALAQATSLKLESEDSMYLLVPVEASWQQLRLTTFQQLQWEWLSASGHIVPWLPQKFPFGALCIYFRSLLGTGILELLQGCPRQDTDHQFHRGCVTNICMTKPGMDIGCHHWDCCCGACEDCLYYAGYMTCLA